MVRFHPHAIERMEERGATIDEVKKTIEHGERFPAKLGRIGFRRNFPFKSEWKNRYYETKQIEAFVAHEGSDYLVITVITRFF